MARSFVIRTLTGIVALTILAASCGGDDSTTAEVDESTTTSDGDSPTTPSTDGAGDGEDGDCPVEVEEVEEAIGTTVTPNEGGLVIAGGSTCEFLFGTGGLVAVRTYDTDAQATYEQTLQVASDEVAVAGVGDMAAWSQLLGTLFAVAGETGLQVQILQPGATEGYRDAAVAVAEAAVPRL